MGARLVFCAVSTVLLSSSFGMQEAIAQEIEETKVFPVLEEWQFQPQSQTLKFETTSNAQPKFFVLREPSRVVVDITGMSWAEGSIKETYSGQISQIRVAEFTAGVTRFVLETSDPAMNLNGDLFKLRSAPGENKKTLWQLSLRGDVGTLSPTTSDTDTNVNSDDIYPPALLPPVIRDSVTVPPPPIPDNLRK